MFDEGTATATRPRETFALSLALHGAAVAVLLAQPFVDRPTPLSGPERTVAEARPVRLVSPPPVWRSTAKTPAVPRPPSAPLPSPERFELPVQADAPRPRPSAAPGPAAPSIEALATPQATPAPLARIELEVAGPRVRQAGFLEARAAEQPPSVRTATATTGVFGASSGKRGPRPNMAARAAGFGGATRARTARPSREGAGAAGFGAVEIAARGSAAGAVRTNGFAAAERGRAMPPRPAARSQASQALRILSKPRPAYTEAARERRIEGEVALRVRFLAAGAVEVLQVVSGLGYGLDEAAKEAARNIRFLPAQEGRRPVDVTATIRIIFQMAY